MRQHAIATSLLVLAALLIGSGVAVAQERPVPDPELSFAVWDGLLSYGPEDKLARVCPAGDGESSIEVYVYDSEWQAIANEWVVFTFEPYEGEACFCMPTIAMTDAEGVARFKPAAGFAETPDEFCIVVITWAECLGVKIPWPNNNNADHDVMMWQSYDLSADCVVSPGDQSIVLDDMSGAACRSDYSLDGMVSLVDYSMHAQHLHHVCGPPVPIPDIYVEPPEISMEMSSGGYNVTHLFIFNVGTAPLTWQSSIGDLCWWLSLEPSEGTIPPNSSTQVVVAFDAEFLGPGDWTCDIVLTSNDPDEWITVVPTDLFVNAGPHVYVEPPAVVIDVWDGGDRNCEVLSIENVGADTLVWSISDTCEWLTAMPESGRVDTLGPQLLDICAQTAGLEPGEYECGLLVASNDFELPELTVPVLLTIHTEAGVNGPGEEPLRTALGQNYPNPFNPTTTIRYSLAEPGDVVLTIYDLTGSPVRTLVERRMLAGRHRARWDGRDASGLPVASGVYSYRLEIDGTGQNRKMVLLK